MAYLPDGYENLQTEKSYVNLSKLPEGEHKFRIVMRPIAGWIDWKDRKPFRYRPDQKPKESFDPEKPLKAFWSCYVWDYAKEGLYIMEISQVSIIKALTTLAKDEDWGDFINYDIKIKKAGTGKETEYGVNPVPHKPLAEHISKALDKKPVRLEALYEGKDPWNLNDRYDDAACDATHILMSDAPRVATIEMLKETLELDGVEADKLEQFINERAGAKNQPAQKVIESALLPALLPTFKRAFAEWLINSSLLKTA